MDTTHKSHEFIRLVKPFIARHNLKICSHELLLIGNKIIFSRNKVDLFDFCIGTHQTPVNNCFG